MTQSTWSRAREAARQTAASRNRFVDFARALAIGMVIIGHWLAAVSYIDNGRLVLTHITTLATWTHWVTWLFQVMPIIFVVGGYANAASWASASRQGRGYRLWIAVRLRRLVMPIMPLVVTWCIVGLLARALAVDPALFQETSRIALQPLWFLAVYILLIVLTPLAAGLWHRYGRKSLVGFGLAAIAVDVVAFSGDLPAIRWLNYGCVWLAAFQLGFLWREQDLRHLTPTAYWASGGLLVLLFLIGFSFYPVSMISVPGAAISNSRPPTIALLALVVTQFGFLRLAESKVRPWLDRSTPWTLTFLINASIMTLFLWHLTALAVVVSIAYIAGGYGLDSQPLSLAWWMSRPAWMIGLLTVLLFICAVFSRFERYAKLGDVAPLPLWRAVGGSLVLCLGLAFLALRGVGSVTPLTNQLFAVALIALGSVLTIARVSFPSKPQT